MSKVVRSSKYRHVFGTEYKKDKWYDNIKPTGSAFDSNFVKVNPKFVAVAWAAAGGGPFACIPQEHVGRLKPDFPLYNGHQAPVNDLDFNPFNDNIIASSGEDCLVKIWQIPDELPKETFTETAQSLSGHQKKAGTILWHPTASNVIASSSADQTIKIWDVETGQCKLDIGDHEDQIQSLTWNKDGSMMGSTCKDKKARLIDPRSQSVATTTEGHYGAKGSRIVWLNNKDRIFTVGFSRSSEREFRIWDPRNMATHLTHHALDNQAGMIMPFYDEDTSVMYLAGKGDGSIRYYEMIDDDKLFYGLSEYKSPTPQKGMAYLPKRGVNVKKCEIARFYKLAGNAIVPIEMAVPRKGDMFQADIFPDTRAYEPSHTGADWFGGANADPKYVSMKPGEGSAGSARTPAALTTTSPTAALEAENAKLKARVAELEAEVAALKAA